LEFIDEEMGTRKLLQITFSSTFDFMDTSHELVERVLQLAKFSEDDIYWLTIAAREAIANAIKHGNKLDSSKKVYVDLSMVDDYFVMKVSDEGEGFDIKSIPDPRNPENLLKNQGRGIYYMQTFMDDVLFESEPGKGTTVTMKKSSKTRVDV
jgi:serine/threonine-protein kinase RsbW